MSVEKDKLLLRVGKSFEANATGPLAIVATVIVFALFIGSIFLR
jgi:hypothetical protein